MEPKDLIGKKAIAIFINDLADTLPGGDLNSLIVIWLTIAFYNEFAGLLNLEGSHFSNENNAAPLWYFDLLNAQWDI